MQRTNSKISYLNLLKMYLCTLPCLVILLKRTHFGDMHTLSIMYCCVQENTICIEEKCQEPSCAVWPFHFKFLSAVSFILGRSISIRNLPKFIQLSGVHFLVEEKQLA